MARKENNDVIGYMVSFNPYKMAIESENDKKIYVDGKQVALSVGSQVNFKTGFKCTLSIEVYYNSDDKEILTEQIPQLEDYGNIIALNPKFKNKKIINKLQDLNIISKKLETVKYKNQNYDLVKVNFDELMLYKPFGNSILKDYKSIEKHRENSKDKEL